MTGQQLFAEENANEINAIAKSCAVSSDGGAHVGHYQTVLKEKWEELDEDDKEDYESRATERKPDISR